ncbi:MAG: dockerin type I domain-containing protein [Candidatus Roizmanbacteria bacterium]|nr:dockerin type I domain-containing protein [Candidatus Roizmanbacteria bacterium]
MNPPLAVEHLKKHWLVLAISFLLLLVVFNFNTVAYLLTRDRNVETTIRADALETRMYFSPASGVFKPNDLIAVSVLLDSTKDPINAVAGEIVFPTDRLEIKSISTKNSINTLWVPVTPYFSTTTNTIIFSGGLPTPGFLGIAGNILTVVFRAKTAGLIELSLINTNVLANDGLGTAIIVPNQRANFSIVMPSVVSYPVEDLNNDGKVDLSDLSIFIAHWGISKNKDMDLNADGAVDAIDLSILLSKLVLLAP